MAALKYFINKINLNHSGQCHRIRNQAYEEDEEEIGLFNIVCSYTHSAM